MARLAPLWARALGDSWKSTSLNRYEIHIPNIYVSHWSLRKGSLPKPIRLNEPQEALIGLIGLPWLPFPRLQWLI